MTLAISRNPSARSAAAPARRRWDNPVVRAGAVYLAALAWTVVIRLPLLRLDGEDDSFFVEVAHLWTHGVLPYAGVFDVKPPGFFALLSLVQIWLGPTLNSLRAVAIVCDATTTMALLYLGRRCGSRSVAIFAAALYPPLSAIVIGNDAYTLLIALTTLAFLGAMSPLPLARKAALAGMLIGAAGAVKQTAGFEALALLVIFLMTSDGAGRRMATAFIFMGSAAIVPVGFLAYFAWHGAARDLVDDAVLAALGRPSSASEGLSFWGGATRLLPLEKGVLALVAFSCLALLRHGALAKALPQSRFAALAAWFLAAQAAILAQRAISTVYLGPLLPPALLLSGLCVTRAAPELARLPRSLRLVALTLATFAFALAQAEADYWTFADSNLVESAAAAVRASGPKSGDKLYVVNRGAWLYAALDLPPPTRYFYTGYTLCNFTQDGATRLDEILASEPRYVVIADRRLKFACEQPARWQAVDVALQSGYQRIAHVVGKADSYDIFERRDPSKPAPTTRASL
jgi:hypothetical protein